MSVSDDCQRIYGLTIPIQVGVTSVRKVLHDIQRAVYSGDVPEDAVIVEAYVDSDSMTGTHLAHITMVSRDNQWAKQSGLIK